MDKRIEKNELNAHLVMGDLVDEETVLKPLPRRPRSSAPPPIVASDTAVTPRPIPDEDLELACPDELGMIELDADEDIHELDGVDLELLAEESTTAPLEIHKLSSRLLMDESEEDPKEADDEDTKPAELNPLLTMDIASTAPPPKSAAAPSPAPHNSKASETRADQDTNPAIRAAIASALAATSINATLSPAELHKVSDGVPKFKRKQISQTLRVETVKRRNDRRVRQLTIAIMFVAGLTVGVLYAALTNSKESPQAAEAESPPTSLLSEPATGGPIVKSIASQASALPENEEKAAHAAHDDEPETAAVDDEPEAAALSGAIDPDEELSNPAEASQSASAALGEPTSAEGPNMNSLEATAARPDLQKVAQENNQQAQKESDDKESGEQDIEEVESADRALDARAERPKPSSRKAVRKSESPRPSTKATVVATNADPGVLMLGAKPPCKIQINGKDTGLSTPQRVLKLPAGKHRITLTNEEHKLKDSFNVSIRSGQKTRVIRDMTNKIQ